MADHIYTDAHRLFVQSLLSHQILTENKALEIYEKVCSLVNGKTEHYGQIQPILISFGGVFFQ